MIRLKCPLFLPTGILSLTRANELLSTCAPGSFLIRVSERMKGYALSYLSEEGCKHFLIDASADSYSFLGADQLQHPTLAELVEYHKVRCRRAHPALRVPALPLLRRPEAITRQAMGTSDGGLVSDNSSR